MKDQAGRIAGIRTVDKEILNRRRNKVNRGCQRCNTKSIRVLRLRNALQNRPIVNRQRARDLVNTGTEEDRHVIQNGSINCGLNCQSRLSRMSTIFVSAEPLR